MRIAEWLHSLGLDALELQMTYGPKTKADVCREYKKTAVEFGITLSVHASYFIVFTSNDASKLRNSRETLKRTFDLCGILGADVIVLHPGPLYGRDSRAVVGRFIENLANCMCEIRPTGIGLFVETAGKVGQLGSVDQILEICEAVPGVFPCIDFGHVHARTLGTLQADQPIFDIFEKLATHGYLAAPKRVHFHYTPINYSSRGEISHKTIHDRYPKAAQMTFAISGNDGSSGGGLYYPRFEPIARALKKFNVDCTVISETHNSQEEGALALKKAFLEDGK
jgi:deoxyribonuclease-4